MANGGWYTEGYQNFGDGIHREYAMDDPDFPRAGVWDALNMVYNVDSDNLEKMGGLLQLGQAIAGSPTITGLFDYQSGTATVAMCSNGNGYVRTTGNWSAISGASGFSTATTTRWSGCMFYGASSGKSLLVLCNGIDAPQVYDGSTMAPLGGGAPSTGNYPVPFMGRLWMFTGDTAYYSLADDCQDFTSAGSGNIQIFHGMGGNITGAYPFTESLIIFKSDKTFRIASMMDISDISVTIVSNIVGTLSHQTISEGGPEGGGWLLFMSDYGFEVLTPTDLSSGQFKSRTISTPVAKLLEQRNLQYITKSWGCFNTSRKEYYGFYPIGNTTTPAAALIANVARSKSNIRWTRTDLNNFTAGCMVRTSGQGMIQIIGDNAGRIYQMHYGHSRSGASYRGTILTKAYTQGSPGAMKHYNRMLVSCETNGTYNVNMTPILGRFGLPRVPSNPRQAVSNDSNDGWAVGLWGEAYWGGSAISGKWVRPAKAARGTYCRVKIETSGSDQWFRLTGLQIESALASNAVRA